ncbi:hypothetical protein [uncultured Schumannella sp.]|uniref:hypothetical protein n=1 Tax=uncultured Schumannella sp. TaxID=1195956 RepID=UPI0025EA9AE5|nr:hypothetical protein [uncultured Schumannella sp.]
MTTDPDAHLRAPRLSRRATVVLVVALVVASVAVAWLGATSASAGPADGSEAGAAVASWRVDVLP